MADWIVLRQMPRFLDAVAIQDFVMWESLLKFDVMYR